MWGSSSSASRLRRQEREFKPRYAINRQSSGVRDRVEYLSDLVARHLVRSLIVGYRMRMPRAHEPRGCMCAGVGERMGMRRPQGPGGSVCAGGWERTKKGEYVLSLP